MMEQWKKILCLLLCLTLFAGVLTIGACAVTYKRGSSGQTVTEMQKRLKRWGYYSGAADGIYGSGTEKAVKYFQQKNGLSADGKAGPATLRAMGINPGTGSGGTASGDEALLARLISAEARGEPYTGQVAVGAVVLNRVEHPSFPNTISGVIYQSGAQSYYWNKIPE